MLAILSHVPITGALDPCTLTDSSISVVPKGKYYGPIKTATVAVLEIRTQINSVTLRKLR